MTAIKDMKLTTIPFSGFYDSIHSDNIDDAERQMFEDRDDGNELPGAEVLFSALFRSCNYRAVRNAYAKDYCENFGRWLKIDSLKFDELKSPRFYNFETDRIFAYLSEADVIRLYNSMPYDKLEALAVKKFTSRDGLSSFYNPDILTWGPVETWDHNQIGTILELAAEEESGDFDSYAEHELVNTERIEQWISGATPDIKRLYKIHEYLELRNKREGVTS